MGHLCSWASSCFEPTRAEVPSRHKSPCVPSSPRSERGGLAWTDRGGCLAAPLAALVGITHLPGVKEKTGEQNLGWAHTKPGEVWLVWVI